MLKSKSPTLLWRSQYDGYKLPVSLILKSQPGGDMVHDTQQNYFYEIKQAMERYLFYKLEEMMKGLFVRRKLEKIIVNFDNIRVK